MGGSFSQSPWFIFPSRWLISPKSVTDFPKVLNIGLVVLNWCLNIGLLLNLCLNKLFGATYPPVCSTVSLEGSVCFCAMGASERHHRVNRTSIRTRMLETQNAVLPSSKSKEGQTCFSCWSLLNITINNLHPKIKLKETWSGERWWLWKISPKPMKKRNTPMIKKYQ